MKKSNRDRRILAKLSVLILGVLLIEHSGQEMKTSMLQQNPPATLTQEEEQYAKFFIKHHSHDPVNMAIAVSTTARPNVMAGIAVVESRGNPQAVGDSGQSRGAFQVQPRYHGTVPMHPIYQAQQAEHILAGLRAHRGSLRQALAHYNGGDTPPTISYAYADRVLKLAREARSMQRG